MSLHIPSSGIRESDEAERLSGSEEDDDDDQTWDDFAENSIADQSCFSLFEDRSFPSVTKALENDISYHNFDINHVCARLGSPP
jgi:type I protein arginine methyltransferase